MKALVIFDTNYGNTRLVADAVAGELGEGARSVAVVDVKDADLAGVGLLVAGSPIIGWKPSERMGRFLAGLGKGRLDGIRAAAFDTRVKKFISGDASGKISRALAGAGARYHRETRTLLRERERGPAVRGRSGAGQGVGRVSENESMIGDNGKSPGGGWKDLYTLGGIAAIVVALAGIADVVLGFSLGGDLSSIPGTAIERFAEFRQSPWLGLYHLDLLNAATTFILMATFLALYAAHRRSARGLGALALVVELVGTAVFVANNAALPMLALSSKYATAPTDAQRTLLAAAGESLLAKGEHGAPGAFPGFLLLSIAGLLMSFVILKGRVFNKAMAWTGLLSNALLLTYVVLMTFVPGTRTAAMLIASPGGLLAVAWLILVAVGLLRSGRPAES